MIDCTASYNASDGIYCSVCTATHCTSERNSGNGIVVDVESTVTGCTSVCNDGDGVRMLRGVTVLQNACSFNGQRPAGGAGIHGTGFDNRTEANNVSFNDRGIDVEVGGNLIIRNSATGNGTEFDIVAENTVKPTVTAGNIATSSNPHANYDY